MLFFCREINGLVIDIGMVYELLLYDGHLNSRFHD